MKTLSLILQLNAGNLRKALSPVVTDKYDCAPVLGRHDNLEVYHRRRPHKDEWMNIQDAVSTAAV